MPAFGTDSGRPGYSVRTHGRAWLLENSTARTEGTETGAVAGSVAPARPLRETFEAVAVGTSLRAARIAMGRNYGEVTRDIRIRDAQLRALEGGRFEDLPGPAYRAGFLRVYADYLGLDGAGLAKRLRASREEEADRPPLRACSGRQAISACPPYGVVGDPAGGVGLLCLVFRCGYREQHSGTVGGVAGTDGGPGRWKVGPRWRRRGWRNRGLQPRRCAAQRLGGFRFGGGIPGHGSGRRSGAPLDIAAGAGRTPGGGG